MINFSFFTNTNYSFEGKKDGEEVILFMRRHWYTIVSKITYIAFGTLLPFILFILFSQIIIAQNLLSIFIFLWATYYMFLWYALFYLLTMYSLDVWIVTNMRIIDSKQHGFFNRTVSELSLSNVQDVSFNLEGAIPTFLNYGDVRVETAGNDRLFQFLQVPNPQFVKDEIMKVVHDTRSKPNL